ncbi:DUF6527 family protein [Mesorhizobium sp.]|uniref:DUF6527 family protein n=1 Tax=Mesorhizobium sp. TaxID=1871066 RepID=UPI00344CA826
MLAVPRCAKPASQFHRCSSTVNSLTERSENFVAVRGPVPEQLQPGILYVNPQGSRAHHLCACGCGRRVLTPLNDVEWELSGSDRHPSLHPSVGNWNLECRSHYLVRNGRVLWARSFSPAEIEACRQRDLRPYQQINRLDAIKSWIRRAINFFRRG